MAIVRYVNLANDAAAASGTTSGTTRSNSLNYAQMAAIVDSKLSAYSDHTFILRGTRAPAEMANFVYRTEDIEIGTAGVNATIILSADREETTDPPVVMWDKPAAFQQGCILSFIPATGDIDAPGDYSVSGVSFVFNNIKFVSLADYSSLGAAPFSVITRNGLSATVFEGCSFVSPAATVSADVAGDPQLDLSASDVFHIYGQGKFVFNGCTIAGMSTIEAWWYDDLISMCGMNKDYATSGYHIETSAYFNDTTFHSVSASDLSLSAQVFYEGNYVDYLEFNHCVTDSSQVLDSPGADNDVEYVYGKEFLATDSLASAKEYYTSAQNWSYRDFAITNAGTPGSWELWNIGTDQWADAREGVGAFYFNALDEGYVGGFYFGPDDYENAIVSAGTPVTMTATVIEPTVNGSTVVTPKPIRMFAKVKDPFVNINDCIDIDFIGTPRAGSSPLVVDYTADITLNGACANGAILSYNWYFDNDSDLTTSATSAVNTISHKYCSYAGDRYDVKLCVILESGTSACLTKEDYVTLCAKGEVRFGANRNIDIISYLPDYIEESQTKDLMQVFEDYLNEMYSGNQGYLLSATELDLTEYNTSASVLNKYDN